MTDSKTLNESIDQQNHPIVALATKPGGALAILRLSGQGCHDLLFQVVKKNTATPWTPNRMTLCRFIDPQTSQWVDEPMAAIFKNPYSYTGEDSAEIYLHGSPFVVEECLKVLFSVGFREALPGEFTRRAFLNGKIDLTKGEGIGALIEAQSKQQWQAAKQLMEGKLEKKINTLRSVALEALAFLEARIDFPEEQETSALSLNQIKKRALQVSDAIETLMDSYQSGKVASQGLKVALVGPPNAGKSTLMNTLLESQRAIVTKTPGTTRDYLEESLLIHGRLIKIIDTAGLRDSTDPIEKEGIERSLKMAKSADLILFLVPFDVSLKEWSGLQTLMEALSAKKQKLIATKSDLPTIFEPFKSLNPLALSCHTSTGVSDLKHFLAQSVDSYVDHQADQVMITSARQKKALEQARESLHAFFTKLTEKEADEILAFELQQTIHHLSSIVGEISHEQVFDKIFSEFCIGK